MKKEIYQSPCITVIEVEHENVMATSSGAFIDGGDPLNSTRGASTHTSAKSYSSNYSNYTSELEDLINDILTIRK